MYAIMGITGRVGGAIAENLLAQGEQIRAIVRNPEKAARWRDRGAEIVMRWSLECLGEELRDPQPGGSLLISHKIMQ
jgi:nucleoside-diphosphate-sugar epimerase